MPALMCGAQPILTNDRFSFGATAMWPCWCCFFAPLLKGFPALSNIFSPRTATDHIHSMIDFKRFQTADLSQFDAYFTGPIPVVSVDPFGVSSLCCIYRLINGLSLTAASLAASCKLNHSLHPKDIRAVCASNHYALSHRNVNDTGGAGRGDGALQS